MMRKLARFALYSSFVSLVAGISIASEESQAAHVENDRLSEIRDRRSRTQPRRGSRREPLLTLGGPRPTPPPAPPAVDPAITYSPGDLEWDGANGLWLSKGLSARLIAEYDNLVPLANGGYSEDRFHYRPDGAAIFEGDNGDYAYVSNSEDFDWNEGGVGAIYFNKDGKVTDYKWGLLNGTTANCAGGKTWWNTWISCEEHSEGQAYEVDPWGDRNNGRKTIIGESGDYFESFAYDNRNPSDPKFYLTVDDEYGAIRRFSPDPEELTIARSSGNYSQLLHSNTGGQAKIDYLVLGPYSNGGGNFYWTSNQSAAEESAYYIYPNCEGLDIHEGMMYVTCKYYQELVILNLDTLEYRYESTENGAFQEEPDQIMLVLGTDQDILYFCEDGSNNACGIHGRDSTGKYYTIMEGGVGLNGETTGIAVSPDNTRMYVAFQDHGKIFELSRTDGYPFGGTTLDIKYHRKIRR